MAEHPVDRLFEKIAVPVQIIGLVCIFVFPFCFGLLATIAIDNGSGLLVLVSTVSLIGLVLGIGSLIDSLRR